MGVTVTILESKMIHGRNTFQNDLHGYFHHVKHGTFGNNGMLKLLRMSLALVLGSSLLKRSPTFYLLDLSSSM